MSVNTEIGHTDMKSVRWDLTPQKTFIIMQTGIIIENMFLFKIYNPDDRNLFFFLNSFFHSTDN